MTISSAFRIVTSSHHCSPYLKFGNLSKSMLTGHITSQFFLQTSTTLSLAHQQGTRRNYSNCLTFAKTFPFGDPCSVWITSYPEKIKNYKSPKLPSGKISKIRCSSRLAQASATFRFPSQERIRSNIFHTTTLAPTKPTNRTVSCFFSEFNNRKATKDLTS